MSVSISTLLFGLGFATNRWLLDVANVLIDARWLHGAARCCLSASASVGFSSTRTADEIAQHIDLASSPWGAGVPMSLAGARSAMRNEQF
jgi:hypothetical protein